MKFEFIETRFKNNEHFKEIIDTDLIKKDLKSLPKNIYLGTSIQFLEIIPIIKKELEKLNKKVIILQGYHSIHKGQILGCDIPKINPKKEEKSAILIISSGTFHATASSLRNKNIELYFLDPFNFKIKKINSINIKGLILKFLDAKNVGILISTKPGQYDETLIKKLEEKFPKKYYKIIQDNINIESLTNFNFLDFFVNTACPRLFDDRDKFFKPILNIDQIIDFFEEENKK